MDKNQFSEISYSQAMQRLGEIAALLENGQISIDNLESIIEESKDLVKVCEIKLRILEDRIDLMGEDTD